MNDETFCPPENFTTPPEGWCLEKLYPNTYRYKKNEIKIYWCEDKEFWVVLIPAEPYSHYFFYDTLEEAFSETNWEKDSYIVDWKQTFKE